MKPETQIESGYMNKVLIRLIPYLALLYTLNILDRNNVSLAALTMQKDLAFSDTVYGFGAGIFFIGYFIFEVPSNIIMEKVGARRWIARIMLSWGAVSVAMMFVKSPLSFYVLRFLLGVAEAGFFPGIMFYLTYWIPVKTRAQVISRFLFLTALMGLLGGPLGGQLVRLNGVYGLHGWQWLFLIEGLPSVLLGFTVWFLLPDGPQDAPWLTEEEKAWVKSKIDAENSESHRVQHVTIRKALSDPRIMHLCLIFFIAVTGGSAVGFFGPKLLKDRSLGVWSDTFVANIGIIPGLVGAIAMVLASRHSDRTGNRRGHVVVGYLIAAIGFLICVFTPSPFATVAALSLNSLGERIAQGSFWALATTIMGPRNAAAGIAFINSVGNLGGFAGPTIMGEIKQRSGGEYTMGLAVATGLIFLATITASFLRVAREKRSEGEWVGE
jgi:ACS family tartrate transporter-like MFS transporter